MVITQRDTEYETDSNENVIILQLESTNAMAMAGYLSYEGKKYDGFYMPHMKSVASDGTFFPLFFSNQQQTVRAQIAALCGIPGNTGARFSKNMEDVPIQCLPDKLHESGYDTIFIKSSDNPRFMDTSYMMSNVGFSEQHYSDIMKEDDKNWGWGYDDCTFYKRAFKFLNEKHSDKKKKFVYMEVGSNHADFHPKEGYEFTHMLDGKENHLARYINSALQQDYCVSEFYENFQTYAPENTHLFILGDHPWGLQTGWAKYEGHAENFFVPFAYVPPRNRKHEFESQKIVDDYYYSQSDIVPTIFELLGKKKYKNSFGYELKKPTLVAGIIPVRQASYERCHVLHELYGGGTTAVVKGLDKYTYVHKDRKIYHGDLSKDLLEEERVLLEEDASFSDFIDEYSCKRFSIKLREDEHT